MPLFEIVGVTSTKLTYSIAIAFAFLTYERENNFIWTLEMLVGLLTSKGNMPKVIVTDRDPTLMKAVFLITRTPVATGLGFSSKLPVGTGLAWL